MCFLKESQYICGLLFLKKWFNIQGVKNTWPNYVSHEMKMIFGLEFVSPQVLLFHFYIS